MGVELLWFLLHASKNPEHEMKVGKILVDAGFIKVVVSSCINNFPKWLPRLESAVVEAYLSEVLDQYLDSVDDFGEQSFWLWGVRRSSEAKGYRAIDSLLSGPARSSEQVQLLNLRVS